LLPVVTLFSIWLAGLLGGSVVIEVIFAIPGMGRLLYDAVSNGDTPVMQAAIVCIVALTVIITTLTDVLYALINPTVRSANAARCQPGVQGAGQHQRRHPAARQCRGERLGAPSHLAAEPAHRRGHAG